MAGGGIFISYRRGSDSDTAGRLNGLLEKRYGADRVFFDVGSIPPGVDFAQRLNSRLQSCGAFIPVIGPSWIEAMPRLDDQGDFVRLEIAAALARPDVAVVPLLVQGADMPKVEDLPPDLADLPLRNAIKVSHEQFETIVDGSLANALDQVVDHARTKSNKLYVVIGIVVAVLAIAAFIWLIASSRAGV